MTHAFKWLCWSLWVLLQAQLSIEAADSFTLEESGNPFKQQLGRPQTCFIHVKYYCYCYINHTDLNWGQITHWSGYKYDPGLAHKPVVLKGTIFVRWYFWVAFSSLKYWSTEEHTKALSAFNMFLLLVTLQRNAHLQRYKWGRNGCVLSESTTKLRSPIFQQNFLFFVTGTPSPD